VGLLLAMNATGVFDLKEALSDMPVIGERFKTDDPVMIIAPLEDENLQLKKNIEELQALLAEKDKEITNFDKEKAEFENKIIVLQNQLKEIEQKEIQSAQLAQIYGKMEDRQQ
jgi:chromosome segregation ATPase